MEYALKVWNVSYNNRRFRCGHCRAMDTELEPVCYREVGRVNAPKGDYDECTTPILLNQTFMNIHILQLMYFELLEERLELLEAPKTHRLDIYRSLQFEDEEKLREIVETVALWGSQDLTLRGDKDSGCLSLEEPLQNDGNFRVLLRNRANAGDIILANHIRTAGSNALHSSPHIQDEFIWIIGKLTRDEIVRQVNEARFFSVLACIPN
ncbi:hypothetical protein HPB48_011432 [Haemaphysalis longicornis]|uniref:Uncharacterized protein n=1 Tax=Haemaphysalis longicornis TaxID=44386 RepID=A0A9J6G6I2_HAELO|nr:hypothetical protein HPB48_011432 [Haemaphysalis longicornis]